MALSDLWYSPGTLKPLQSLSSKGHPVRRLIIFRNSLEPHLTLGAPFLIAATKGIACGVFCVHFWIANRFVLSSKSNKTYCVPLILSTAALLKVTPFRVTDARGPVPPKDTIENPLSSLIVQHSHHVFTILYFFNIHPLNLHVNTKFLKMRFMLRMLHSAYPCSLMRRLIHAP